MHSQSSATWQDRKHRKFLLEGKRATWVFKLHLGGTRAKNKKQKKIGCDLVSYSTCQRTLDNAALSKAARL